MRLGDHEAILDENVERLHRPASGCVYMEAGVIAKPRLPTNACGDADELNCPVRRGLLRAAAFAISQIELSSEQPYWAIQSLRWSWIVPQTAAISMFRTRRELNSLTNGYLCQDEIRDGNCELNRPARGWM